MVKDFHTTSPTTPIKPIAFIAKGFSGFDLGKGDVLIKYREGEWPKLKKDIEQLCQKLKKNKERQRSELLSYFTLDLIAKSAPYQAIRTVYSELLRQFFWANVFQGMKGNQEVINRLYAPYEEVFIESLEKRDFPCFSAKLEELIIHDLRKILGFLSKLGVTETEKLFIPDESKN